MAMTSTMGVFLGAAVQRRVADAAIGAGAGAGSWFSVDRRDRSCRAARAALSAAAPALSNRRARSEHHQASLMPL
jgi:hypothetical protein